ncbi:AAA family ATPase [Lichenihabitans sp. Uapishka_5]|uniref:ATP-dependent DNA helicase n=1 Tax=Lichenihabitans sp. Uapishka_5 TaxID=3037302 RepID=UPI0029E7DC62|nr:AAA family ATPase [Lichenihabitans sp. Uapishka_5]MDX7952904.1 AAA family ATPase [Lichenihabitans sp. Uapishka_5]
MKWSPEQDAALKAVSAWAKRSDGPQVFRLFGFAGTGKTTLARTVAEDSPGSVAFGAYTGKAALVLRSKGCTEATTIHSLIYRTRDTETETPSFVLNGEGAASKADLIVIDECSMVDEDLGRDLLSFGTKVLVLGDPAQIPPVRGGGFFTEAEPDVMLREVHRQAADNPIIRLSMAVRDGGRLSIGDYGESRVIPRAKLGAAAVLKADQLLVGTNRSRRNYNRRMRELLGFAHPMPEAGEKLVCLRNDKKKGLLNGGTWTVERLHAMKGTKLRMSLVPEGEAGRPTRVSVLPAMFEDSDEEIPYALRRDSDEFDYGYALTVHKAQGSQWDSVVLFDESASFREHASRWLYTGITRASHRLTVVV